MKINFNNFGACVAKIQAKGRLSDTEAKDLLQELANRAEEMRKTGQADPIVKAAGELAAKLKDDAVNNRIEALRNAGKRKVIWDDSLKNAGLDPSALRSPENIAAVKNGALEKVALSIESQMVPINSPLARMRGNVEDTSVGLIHRWMSAFDNQLRRDGLEHAVHSGGMDDQMARALWEMSQIGPKLPKPASDLASKAAYAAAGPLREMTTRLQAAGARFQAAMDYIAKTQHDPRAMGDAGYAKWWADTKARLSDYTFRDLVPKEGETLDQAKDRFGLSVYNALRTGVHLGQGHLSGFMADETGYVAPAFEGSRNLAKKFSHQRVMYWKDADSWMAHMRQYGGMTTLYEVLHNTMNQAANAIALMDKFGSNPSASLNLLLRKVEEEFRDADPEAVVKFQKWKPRLTNEMGRLDGSLNTPVNADAAILARTIRTFESSIKLPFVGLTHLASLPATLGSLAPHYGLSRLEVYSSAFKSILGGVSSDEAKTIISEAGAFSHGSLAHMFAQWRTDTSIPGRVSSLAAISLKASGLNRILERTQAGGVKFLLMHHLGRQIDKAFDDLHPLLRNNMNAYGMNAEVWELMRNLPDLKTYEGRRYLTPRDLMRIPNADIDRLNTDALSSVKGDPEAIQAETERLRSQKRWEIADGYAAFLAHAAKESTVAAGVRERAIALGSLRPGTLSGELMRMILTFKMWPLAAINQMMGREWYSAQSALQKGINIGTLFGLSTLAGLFRMSVRDALTGTQPRDPREHPFATLGAAAAQGGGVGILGDFLFSEVSRFGTGFLGTLAGPVASDVNEFANIFFRFRDDTWHKAEGEYRFSHKGRGYYADIWPDLARYVQHHIPMINWIGLQAATNYLFWYSAYDALSPGWYQRTNQRMMREQGRTMMFYKPGQKVPGIFSR